MQSHGSKGARLALTMCIRSQWVVLPVGAPLRLLVSVIERRYRRVLLLVGPFWSRVTF